MTNLIVVIIFRKSESAVWVTIVENASFNPRVAHIGLGRIGRSREIEEENISEYILAPVQFSIGPPILYRSWSIGILEGLPEPDLTGLKPVLRN